MGRGGFSGFQFKYMLLLAMASVVLSSGVEGKSQSALSSSEIERKLKFVNRPAVKTIQSEDGDIVDCVDIYKQSALDHPALRNHTIQMRPSYHPQISETSSARNERPQTVIPQTWHRSGSCPNGTVPIRRIQKEDLLRATSLESFGRKNPQIYNAANETIDQDSHISTFNQSKWVTFAAVNRSAAVLCTFGTEYTGALGDINVWTPTLESLDDYSSGQIWIKNGPINRFESIEAGWMVNPKLYGDTHSRIFVYWTVDSSNGTGCFDLVCSGFVQINRRILLGGSLTRWSVKNGPQYIISLQISRDPSSGNWWLTLDSMVVGYWPGPIFNFLIQSATSVEWGGEVYSSHVKTNGDYHTATALGSGEFGSPQHMAIGVTSYITNIRVIDSSVQLRYPEWVSTWADEPACYSAYNDVPTNGTEPMLFFGGPGRNFPDCP